MLCYHEESGYKNLVVYVCLNAVLVEFSLTRGICRRCLIRIRVNYHEKLGFSISGDTIRTHEHCLIEYIFLASGTYREDPSEDLAFHTMKPFLQPRDEQDERLKKYKW